jgi:hypothetical protein
MDSSNGGEPSWTRQVRGCLGFCYGWMVTPRSRWMSFPVALYGFCRGVALRQDRHWGLPAEYHKHFTEQVPRQERFQQHREPVSGSA